MTRPKNKQKRARENMKNCLELAKKRKLAAKEQDENHPNLGKDKKSDPSTSSKKQRRFCLQETDQNIIQVNMAKNRQSDPTTNPNDTDRNLTFKSNEVKINIAAEGASETCGDEQSTVKSQNSENEQEILTTTEKENEIKTQHVGRRIVDVSYFCKQLLDLCNHGPLGCSASDIILTGEKQNGLLSKFTFKCKMCNLNFLVNNDCCDDNYLNLNTCAVAGTVATGCGQSQLEEFLSAMNLPVLTEPVYNSNHSLVSKHWERVALNEILEAGKQEKEIAIAEGKVTDEGYGVVDVIVDGCWSKRSYKKNYSALSGAAAIIGKNTGKILFIGVKNKYCQTCAMAEKDKKEVKDHVCFKNYEGPSTGMESQILVEGFKNSTSQHGLIYGRLISDGDSSTYTKILQARPYNKTTVEKVECRNHIMRNFCNKLQALSTDTKYLLKHRKCLTKKSILTIRSCIIKAIRKHKDNSDIQLLFDDILRCHPHAFGDHTRCRSYFCNNVGSIDKERVPSDFFTSALWQRLSYLVQGVAAHSRSLILDVDSNRVESFHGVVAKFVGGKRINFTKKDSYQLRVKAAAVAFNTKKSISRLYKSLNGSKSPTGKLKRLEEKRISKNTYNKIHKKPKRRLFKNQEKKDKDYGESCVKEDIEMDSFERLKKVFVENLAKTEEERERIQKNTILQSESGEWMELRRSLLTASNFGKIIKRRNDTSCANVVKELLYKPNLDHVASIKHGRENEKKALLQLSSQIRKKITSCGLFIDSEHPFLGATPDGLCGNDIIVEVKCPITAHKIGITEAIAQKKITFWKMNKQGREEVNKTHNWYYQVQGQLHVTKRQKCIFAVWANENDSMKIEIIDRDDDFWHKKMEEKLIKFYMDCMLPELVDPRHPRNLPIRDPEYLQDMIAKKKDQKLGKHAAQSM